MPKALPNLNPAKAVRARKQRAERGVSLPDDFMEFLPKHIRVHFDDRVLPWSPLGHEYLVEPISDPAPHKAIQKGTQLGFTTGVLAWVFHRCGFARWRVGYHLPTDAHVRPFVSQIVDDLIDLDPTDILPRLVVERDAGRQLGEFARKRRKGADNTTLKSIGAGWVVFTGTENPNDVISFPYSAVVLDELDRLSSEIASQIEERLLHSKIANVWALSRPELPNLGINARYNSGDQRRWLLRCAKCRQWVCLEDSWPECLYQVRGEWRIGCPRCHCRLPYLTGSDRSAARWVPSEPGRPLASWRVSQLYGPAMTADRAAALLDAADHDSAANQSLHRAVLGKPFAGEEQPVNEAVFNLACRSPVAMRPQPPDGAEVYCGVDTGDVLYLSVVADLLEEGLAAFWFESFGKKELGGTGIWDALRSRMVALNPRFVVILGRPEHSEAVRMAQHFQRQAAVGYESGTIAQTIYGVEGIGGARDGELKLQHPEDVYMVKFPRDDSLDDMCADVANGRLLFPKRGTPDLATVGRHFQALVRSKTGDPPRWSYVKGVDNHWAFSTLASLIGRRMALALHLGPTRSLTGRTLSISREELPRQW